MTEAEQLLEACRLHPDEDTPRLLLADHLQENGCEDAAVYIRESIEHARVGNRGGIRYRKKTGGAYRLWLASLFAISPSVVANTWDRFELIVGHRRRCILNIHRGLPRDIAITAPLLMEQPAEVFRFPLTTCRVSDRIPNFDHDQPGNLWFWWSSPYPQKHNTWEESAHHIPSPLWTFLEGATHSVKFYTRRSDAITRLNAAAFRFGLASLTQPTEPVSSS